MKKFIVGIIIGSLLSTGISYAYRVAKPQRIIAFDANGLVILNEALERLWDLTNGRYNCDVVTSIPSGSTTEGDMKAYYSGSTRRLYLYINGAWRFINTDG